MDVSERFSRLFQSQLSGRPVNHIVSSLRNGFISHLDEMEMVVGTMCAYDNSSYCERLWLLYSIDIKTPSHPIFARSMCFRVQQRNGSPHVEKGASKNFI